VYVCESCDALWTHPDIIGPHTAVPIQLFFSAQQLTLSAELLGEKEYHWDRTPDPLEQARIALEADPSGVSARLHLASLLLSAGEAQEALEHSALALQQEPANLQALYIAA
jgi:hypothetical protein